MDTGIRIEGGKLDGASAKAARELVEGIFKAGFQNHMEQDTIQCALEKAFGSLSVSGMNLTGCSVVGDKTVNT